MELLPFLTAIFLKFGILPRLHIYPESMNSNNSVSNNSKFDVRAPPRRRAKKDAREDQPIFLRKAYAMVSACPADIGKNRLNLSLFICFIHTMGLI